MFFHFNCGASTTSHKHQQYKSKDENSYQIVSSSRILRQSGFTLIELIAVITLLGIIAGLALTAYENVQEQARYDVARYEMTQIRDALLQFRRDSGSKNFPGQGIYDCTDESNGGVATDINANITFPAEAGSTAAEIIAWCRHPANFWMLFEDPLGNGWNPDTQRGWRGPYLYNSRVLITGDAGYQPNGTYTATGTTITGLWGINDPYGAHYYLFDLDNADSNNPARLVSLAENLTYDDNAGTSDCSEPSGSGDYPLDLLLCLLK